MLFIFKMKNKCPEILLNCAKLIKLKAGIFFALINAPGCAQAWKHRCVEQFLRPHCWAATVKETHTERGARAPPGERAQAPFSLLCSLLVTGF